MAFYLLMTIFAPMMLQTTHPLAEFQWKKRIILLSGNKEKVDQQEKRYLKLQNELEDRDIIIITYIDKVLKIYPDNSENEIDAKRLADYYNLQEDFISILIGKDGTIKSRDKMLLFPQYYFTKIDGMPMRRAEMRKKNGGMP